jgi:hypothetical protein
MVKTNEEQYWHRNRLVQEATGNKTMNIGTERNVEEYEKCQHIPVTL